MGSRSSQDWGLGWDGSLLDPGGLSGVTSVYFRGQFLPRPTPFSSFLPGVRFEDLGEVLSPRGGPCLRE